MQKQASFDRVRIQILGVVLLLPKVLEFIGTCFGSFSPVTIWLYVVVFIITILKCKTIKISDITILMIVYVIFAFNYLLFDDTRKYMLEQDMLLIYFFFIPIGVFVFKEIQSWNDYERILYPFSVVSVLLNTLVFVFRDQGGLSYMEVSYSLLPFLAILYSCSRNDTNNKNRVVSLIFFVVGTVEIFSFGARGPMLFLLIFILLYEILREDVASYKKILLFVFGSVFGILVIAIISIFSKSIIEYLSNSKIFENSYILQHLSNGGFFQHETRNNIYQRCLRRIESMGMEVSGLFGDRYYCGSVYPHNIVFELLMSLGWIFGLISILLLLILILRSVFIKEKRTVAAFLITTLFLRFFVSGSYLIEGKFWVFLFALISLQHKKKTSTTNRKIIE